MEVFAKGENIRLLEGLKMPVTEQVRSLSNGFVFLNAKDSMWSFFTKCNITSFGTGLGEVMMVSVQPSQDDSGKFDYDITLRVHDIVEHKERVIYNRVLFTTATPIAALLHNLDE